MWAIVRNSVINSQHMGILAIEPVVMIIKDQICQFLSQNTEPNILAKYEDLSSCFPAFKKQMFDDVTYAVVSAQLLPPPVENQTCNTFLHWGRGTTPILTPCLQHGGG